MPRGLDGDEDGDAGLELLTVEQRDPALDVAGVLELLHPAPAGRGRQTDGVRQFGERQAGILLQAREDAQVEGIKEKNLIEERILDSMQFLDFIMFLGELVGRDVSTAITVDDLRTVDAIVNFVQVQR